MTHDHVHVHVSIMHGSDTHHAYRPTEDVVSVANGYCRFSRSELHIGIANEITTESCCVGRIDIGRATCGIVAAWLLLGMRMVGAWPRDDGVLCGT